MTEIEFRSGSSSVDARAEGDKRTLAGYAVVWNSDAQIGDAFIERIAPGAFSAAIRGDVLALVSHDYSRVIGRTKSGTLRLSEDDRGLKVEIDVPNTSDGNDLWELVGRKDIAGMSFGFRATKQEWDDTGDVPHRTVIEAELYEVTATPIPAYPDTTLAARSLEAARAEADKAKADADKRAENAAAAQRRLAQKRMTLAQRIRGIRQDAT